MWEENQPGSLSRRLKEPRILDSKWLNKSDAVEHVGVYSLACRVPAQIVSKIIT